MNILLIFKCVLLVATLIMLVFLFYSTSKPTKFRIHRKNSSTVFSRKKANSFVNTKKNIQLHNPSLSNVVIKDICSLVPPKLVGALKVIQEAPSFDKLEAMFPSLEPGGMFRPPSCTSRHRVAIVIPFRDREEHLRIFLHNVHPLLMRQQLQYGIYVIEEAENQTFNRAMLMNIGFMEALKRDDYQCFILHDVDLIPEDDRNIYSCPEQPRHMSVAISTMNYRLPYETYFGGVSALKTEHMWRINGMSNSYWGWGGEDDDLYDRIRSQNLSIIRPPASIARYTMLKHIKGERNPKRFTLLKQSVKRLETDGLSNLKYKVENIVLNKLFTRILVQI